MAELEDRISASLARPAVHRREREVRSTGNLRGNDGFVAFNLVWIDLAIMVDVEDGEEAIGIDRHFVESEPSVMVPIRLTEPLGEPAVAADLGTERLAHRADERPAAAAAWSHWRGSRRRLRRAGRGKEQQWEHRTPSEHSRGLLGSE